MYYICLACWWFWKRWTRRPTERIQCYFNNKKQKQNNDHIKCTQKKNTNKICMIPMLCCLHNTCILNINNTSQTHTWSLYCSIIAFRSEFYILIRKQHFNQTYTYSSYLEDYLNLYNNVEIWLYILLWKKNLTRNSRLKEGTYIFVNTHEQRKIYNSSYVYPVDKTF